MDPEWGFWDWVQDCSRSEESWEDTWEDRDDDEREFDDYFYDE